VKKKKYKYIYAVLLLISISLNFFLIGKHDQNISLKFNSIKSSSVNTDSFLSTNVKKEPFNASSNGIQDDTNPIQEAINFVSSKGGGKVYLPNGEYKITKTLYLPDDTSLIGEGQGKKSTVIQFSGKGFAIKSTGEHKRINIENLRLELSGKNSGIHLGDIGERLSNSTFPAHMGIRHVTVGGIGVNQIGIKLSNVSHINILDVSSGYGNTTGGHGLFIFADKLNSGVLTAEDSTFGRVDSTTVGMEIDGTVNLDTYSFTGCYFGGQLPIRLGKNSVVRNINFTGIHIEGRGNDERTNLIEIYNVVAVNFFGTSLIGFKESDNRGFVFKGKAEKVNILGVEANGLMGAIYANEGAELDGNSLFQKAELTNGSKAKQYMGDF